MQQPAARATKQANRGPAALAVAALALLGACASQAEPERFALDGTMRSCLEQTEAQRWYGRADQPQPRGRSGGEVRALVVGADYAHATDPSGREAALDMRLPNTLNDACLVNAAFDDLPHAYSSFLPNPTAESLQQALDIYLSTLTDEDIAIFYFAGHGVQAGGYNYFIMTDGRWAVQADQILELLSQRAKFAVFIVDACRAPPLPQPAATRPPIPASRPGVLTPVPVAALDYASRGLTQVGRARGTKSVVQFSTEPGNFAWDGDPGSFSPFARAIYHQVGERVSFEEVSRRVQNRVACEIELWADAREFRRCDDPSFARDTASAAAERVAQEGAAGRETKFVQFPWRQGDVGEPIYLAGEPRFPVP